MPSTAALAAAEGLPKFDPDAFDLGLVHLARLCDLMVAALCDVDRTGLRPESERALLDADSLVWIARAHATRLSEQFQPRQFRPLVS